MRSHFSSGEMVFTYQPFDREVPCGLLGHLFLLRLKYLVPMDLCTLWREPFIREPFILRHLRRLRVRLASTLRKKMGEVEKRRRRDKEKAGVSLGMRPFFCLPFRRNCETLEALAGNFDGKNI